MRTATKSSKQPKIKFFYYRGSGVEIFQNTLLLTLSLPDPLYSDACSEITSSTLYLNGMVISKDYDMLQPNGLKQKITLRNGIISIIKLNKGNY